MAIYQINSTGNTIVASQAFMDGQYPADYTLITTTGAYPVYLGTKITPRSFFQRMGTTNLLWLYGQLSTNPALAMYKDQVMSADFVDLSDPITLADLDYLLTLSGTPFTAAIVASILNTPVSQNEVPS